MRALITGASSGIGRQMAIYLSEKKYELILVSRDKDSLEETKKMCKTKCFIEVFDLSDTKNCYSLFNKYKDVDLLINNAGFGVCDEFIKTSLDSELNMIDLNIKAVHILTKLYLSEMVKKDSGRILNVSSIAAYMTGPLMSTYYSTKSYVYRFTTAIYEELRRNKSNVKISVLCPGPINTKFLDVADVKFSVKTHSSNYVAKYAIDKMFKNKLVIIPGIKFKFFVFLSKILPVNFFAKLVYNFQRKKAD